MILGREVSSCANVPIHENNKMGRMEHGLILIAIPVKKVRFRQMCRNRLN